MSGSRKQGSVRDGWHQVALREIATQQIDPFDVDPDGRYINLGVQWYAQGVFARPAKRGSEMKATRLFRVQPGQFIYNRMFVTEGSFGVVRDEHAAGVVSNEFPVFTIDSARVLTEYLALYFQQPQVWERAAGEATGTTKSRRRWKEAQFLAHTVALPPLDEQQRIVDLIAAVDSSIGAAEGEAESLLASLESTRDLIVWGASGRTPLGQIAQVVGGLVDPTSAENSALPHIGTERITSVTGDLHGVLSAAEDGVTSGKYLHDAGTIIYSKIRPNLRKVAIPTWRGLCSADAYPIRPIGDASGVSFLRHLLISRPFTEMATSRSGRTKMPKINRSELFSIEVPDIEIHEQVRIAEKLDAIDAARLAARATADALRALRGNVLTVLLSGEHEIPASYDRFLKEAAA